MFKECLNDLPYVSDIADECYFNIKLYYDNRDKQIFDDSFLTTMRIALSKRTENRVDLVYFYKDTSNYINFSGNDFISKLTDDLSSTTNRYTQLFIFNLDNYREQIVDDCFERLNSFATYFDGFEEINDLKAFFEQKKIAKCRFFTNYERKTTVIFVKKLTPRVNHMLQSLLPRYLKWEFEDAPITDDEKKLFRSLTQKTAVEYVEIINNYAKSQNFEEIKIKRLLGDFDKRIFSYYTPRMSRLKDVDKVAFFGLQAFIKKYLIKDMKDSFFDRDIEVVVREYERILNNTLGEGAYESNKIRALHKLGYLPIEIKAVAEGVRTNIGVPQIEISNTHPDFVWVVNTIESVLSAYM